MQVAIEKYYPITISFLATLALVVLNNLFRDLPGLIDKLSDNALGISTTLVGFFLTILTIVNSIDTRRMRFIKSANLFPRLMRYLNHAIKYNVILIAFSFIVKYVEHRNFAILVIHGRNIVDYFYLFCFMFALLISIRFINIFVHLLTDVSPHE